MTANADSQRPLAWLESCNFVRIFRTFRMAVQPSKLALAFAALVLTLAWGGVLDQFWRWADRGVDGGAIVTHYAGLSSLVSETTTGNRGIFITWAEHTARSIESLPQTGCAAAVSMLIAGCAWLVTQHTWYALLFYVGALAIWSLLGGAICRMAAVQFAREETVSWREAVKFVRERYFSGFALAPLLPLLIIVLVGLVMALGGVFLRIPYLGDVLGSLLFFLAILGGAVIAFVAIGWAVGGWLFWPTIAAEGSEALDAVSRSFNYVGATPWKTVFYALVAGVYGYLCFWFVRLLAFLVLAATHLFVGFGTAPCGLWLREDGLSKLEALWAMPTMSTLRATGASLSGVESFAGAVVGVWVFAVIVLVWAYLASFCLSASTVIYFLLRQDNDAMDLDDVYIESYDETDYASEAPEPAPASGGTEGAVQVTVAGESAAAQPADSAPDAEQAAPAEEPTGGDETDDEGKASDSNEPPAGA